MSAAASAASAEVKQEQLYASGEGQAIQQPVLPPQLLYWPKHYWAVGVSVEGFGRVHKDNNGLYGLSVMYREGPWGPHAFLMSNGATTQAASVAEQLRNLRGQLGLGLRGYFPWLGTEWSYGVSAHLETRLEDHFWLAYATPLELGAVIYSENSWNVQIFAGLRSAFAGQLVNHYLIDPNGFDSAKAQDELQRVSRTEPWLGFLRITFAREIQ